MNHLPSREILETRWVLTCVNTRGQFDHLGDSSIKEVSAYKGRLSALRLLVRKWHSRLSRSIYNIRTNTNVVNFINIAIKNYCHWNCMLQDLWRRGWSHVRTAQKSSSSGILVVIVVGCMLLNQLVRFVVEWLPPVMSLREPNWILAGLWSLDLWPQVLSVIRPSWWRPLRRLRSADFEPTTKCGAIVASTTATRFVRGSVWSCSPRFPGYPGARAVPTRYRRPRRCAAHCSQSLHCWTWACFVHNWCGTFGGKCSRGFGHLEYGFGSLYSVLCCSLSSRWSKSRDGTATSCEFREWVVS